MNDTQTNTPINSLPKINIAELVDAFRAQEQEKLDAAAEAHAKWQAEAERKAEVEAGLAQAAYPAISEAAQLLPDGRAVFAPVQETRGFPARHNRLEIFWTYSPRHGTYTISRVLSVTDDENGTAVYTLGYGSEGGYLLDKPNEVPCVPSTSNLADILIPLARWAGLSKANNW
jgi:hypothetical protein